MLKIKENLWKIAIIAGIFGIISIFTPTLYIDSDKAFVWVWNLYVSNGSVDFVQVDEPLYNIGVVATIIISIGTLITLSSGVISKVKDRSLNLVYLIGGILLLLGPIIYLAGITVEDKALWDYVEVNIGSILPFIAGALLLLGTGIVISKRKS
ncbi:MAG: hypothetical protein KGD58_17195 [Candidatus Lokiarchaeota archaeon]|nr:hypothetical protein [Candidatus Lokiarchaeota archaeon]